MATIQEINWLAHPGSSLPISFLIACVTTGTPATKAANVENTDTKSITIILF